MANWGADFWGAYSDVARAHAAKQLFEQQMAGRRAFGQALQDPNIFLPGTPQTVGAGNPQGGFTPGGDMSREENAISGIESGGRYNALGRPTRTGDRAYGKYQVMGANIPSWTAAAGQRETPQQFLADANMQDKVFKQQFGANEAKYGPAGAASMWFTGRPNAPNAKDVNGTTGNQYVQRFTQLMGQTPQNVAQTASAIGGQPAGQMSWQHIVQAIVAKNPNIDPGVLSQAVELFQPLMSQQSQMDWREQSLQLREAALQLAQAKAGTQAEQTGEKIGLQKDRLKLDADKAAAIQTRFNASNDARLAGLKQRGEEFAQRMAAAKNKSDRDFLARQMKANADQYHQRMTELIQRGSSMQGAPMSPDDQKKSMDEETQRYEAEKARIQGLIDQSNTQTDQGASSGGKSQAPASSAGTPSKTPPTASQATPKAYTDPGEFSKDLAAGTIAPGATYQDPEKGLLKFQGGNVRDSKNWVPVKAQQSSMNAAPRKPFIDFQTPSAMGPRESLMQAFFGG